MRIDEIRQQVRHALEEGLPGLEAQLALAPHLRPGWPAGGALEEARAAAALLVVFPRRDIAHLLLTLRASALPHHAAQISLPGGRVEPGETIEQAALREAHEETGLDPLHVEVLGSLTPIHIAVSGFMLHPVLGVAEREPRFQAAAREVERILEVPVADLLDETRFGWASVTRAGMALDVPCFRLAGEEVWGATAMVLAELRWLLGHPARPPAARPRA
jgi:8-oxo-dGTP pyrophosphatase MutT (NUDIX family)